MKRSCCRAVVEIVIEDLGASDGAVLELLPRFQRRLLLPLLAIVLVTGLVYV